MKSEIEITIEMESGVESTLETPIFRPTMTEFENFGRFIKKLETLNISFAKVSNYFVISVLSVNEFY